MTMIYIDMIDKQEQVGGYIRINVKQSVSLR